MFYHQVYAQIINEIVQNIIVCTDYHMANVLAKNTYGEEAIAVECTYYDCGVGDTYKDNTFYAPDGKERQYKGSEAENIAKLEAENKVLNNQVSEDNETLLDLDYRVSVLEEA